MTPYATQLFKCHEMVQLFVNSGILSKWKLFSLCNFLKFELFYLGSLIFSPIDLIIIQLIKRKMISK